MVEKKLGQVKLEPVPEIVQEMSDMLELAKQGKLRSIVFVAEIDGQGSTQFDYLPAETHRRFEYIGRLQVAATSIQLAILGSAE